MNFYKKKNNPNLKKKTFFRWGLGVGGCRVSEFYRESKSKKNNRGGRGEGGGGFGGGGYSECFLLRIQI